MLTPRSSRQWPAAIKPANIVASSEAPSTIAASTTWPRPLVRASMTRTGDAECEQHAAAAEVADQVERRHRRLAGAADRVQHAGERDVVDVVAGALGERTVLAPAGHAAVDEARVARVHGVGPEAEALHHAGPEALDQRVGAARTGATRLRRRTRSSGRGRASGGRAA